MKKKIISILLAAVMVTTLAAGCGSSGDSNEGGGSADNSRDKPYEGVELTYWSMCVQHRAAGTGYPGSC